MPTPPIGYGASCLPPLPWTPFTGLPYGPTPPLLICWESCFYVTCESKQADVIGEGEGSILPHAAIEFHEVGTSLSNTLTSGEILMVEIGCKTGQQSLYTVLKVTLYQHTPPAKPACLPVTPSLCLFLGQTNFFQDPLIIFSFHAKYKPCYPLCLEHPPTF